MEPIKGYSIVKRKNKVPNIRVPQHYAVWYNTLR